MKVSDAIIGAVLALFAIAVFAYTRTFPPVPGQTYGPSLFPGLIAIGLFASGTALIVRGWRQRSSVPWVALAPWTRSRHHLASFTLGIASVVFYISTVERLGFVITVAILLISLMTWLRRRLWSSLAIALPTALAVYILFHQLLKVPLPEGTLFPIGL